MLRYLRKFAQRPTFTDPSDPLSIELRPLSWKEELSSSVSDSAVSRILLALSPVLPNHAPSFTFLRRLVILCIVLAAILAFLSRTGLSDRFMLVGPPPCPSPFQIPGFLHVNPADERDNYWTPEYANPLPPSCSPERPQYLEILQDYLASPVESVPVILQPLANRTVLLFGDSLDRNHLEHFCTFLNHAPRIIYPSDALYPSDLRDLEEDLVSKSRFGRPFGSDRSRPWICHIPEPIDLMLVWVFSFGSDDGVTTPGPLPFLDTRVGNNTPTSPYWGPQAFWPDETEHFNPPLASEDRITQLVLPLLENLGRTPDLVEIGVGAWDLDMFKRQDHVAVQHYFSLHPEDRVAEDQLVNDAIRRPLAGPLVQWCSDRLQSVVQYSLSVFPTTTPVYLRPLHVTPQYYRWPYLLSESRIRQIDELTRQTVASLRTQQRPSWGARRRPRLWMDNNSAMIEGKSNETDHIHPRPLPGSWVWSQWLLYTLQRSAVRNNEIASLL